MMMLMVMMMMMIYEPDVNIPRIGLTRILRSQDNVYDAAIMKMSLLREFTWFRPM